MGEVVAPVGVGPCLRNHLDFRKQVLWTVSLFPDGGEAENLDGHQGVLLDRGAC